MLNRNTTPLEAAVSRVPGLRKVESLSREEVPELFDVISGLEALWCCHPGCQVR